MTRWAAALCLALTACGGESAPPPPPAAQDVNSQPAPDGPVVRLYAVDLDGNPLPGMLPIATRKANAFDTPVVYGDKTGADGLAGVVLPRTDRLWVRAWDPELNWFAVNVYDVVANVGNETELMTIQMARAGSLSVVLQDSDGVLLSGKNVGLRMSHPTRGPWWHAEGKTDAAGRVTFAKVPPGEYLIGMTLESGERAEWGVTRINPGATVDLGSAAVQ